MEVPINSIRIGKRFRQEYGDIVGLARSIQGRGLLQPVVLATDMTLVCGERRLLACKELGWDNIPARIVNLDEDGILLAERDENEQRKPFTVSELVAIGKAIEELEKPKAKDRQKHHGKTAPGKPKNTPEEFTEVNGSGATGEAAKIAASRVGMSRPTYEKAKEVVEAAEKEPEVFGDLAEQMDRTGKVEPAVREKRRREEESGKTPPKQPKPYDVQKDVIRIRELIDRLSPNWERDEDKIVIRQLFKQLVNEV